ncbi:MAG: hypothetical protein AAF958_03465 [Planctomycetota bacterium]
MSKPNCFMALPLIVLAGTLSGCSMMGKRASDQIQKTIPLSANAKLEIETFNGYIKVVSGDVDEIELLAKRYAKGPTIEDAEDNLDDVEIETQSSDDGVVVSVNKPGGFQAGVSFELTIPKDWQVDAKTSNGAIVVRDASGVKLKSSNGSITISGSPASVVAETSNGAIKAGSRRPAEVALKTSNGGVSWKGPLVAGDHRIRTSNGAIYAEVQDTSAKVVASTSNGRIVIDGVSAKGSLEKTLGEDPNPEVNVQIETKNGGVRVDYKTTSPDDSSGDDSEVESGSETITLD